MDVFNSKLNMNEDRTKFLDTTKAARHERIKEKKDHQMATIIQANYRRYKVCNKLKEEIIIEFDETIKEENGEFKFIKAIDAFKVFRRFLFFFNSKTDKERFDLMCKYIISSMFTNESKNSKFKLDYTSVCLEQKFTSCWLNQVKKILVQCLVYLKQLRPELSNHQSFMMLYLNVLINLTSCTTWSIFTQSTKSNIEPLLQVMNRFCSNLLNHLIKNEFYQSINELLTKTLCRTRISIKKSALTAALTLSIRPLINSKFSNEIVVLFINNILSIPAFIHQVLAVSDDNLKFFNSDLLVSCIEILSDDKHSNKILATLEGNYSLCLLANIVHLCYVNIDYLEKNDQIINDFVQIVRNFLEHCGKYVVNKQTSLTHWHSILGWFSQSIEKRLHDSLPFVKVQLQLLWNAKMIQLLFKSLLETDFNDTKKENECSSFNGNNDNSLSVAKSLFRKAAYFVSSRTNYDSISNSLLNNSNTIKKEISIELFNICNICSTYVIILKTLSQLRLEILTGICYQDKILMRLWKNVWPFGAKNNNLNLLLNSLEQDPNVKSPEFQLLILVCDCSTYLITLLDDKEFYEEQKAFQIDDLIQISSFLNNFIFRMIYIKQIDIESTPEMKYLFQSMHGLLVLLYRRDSRREFVPKDHWLIKEIKVSNFIKELENNKKHAELVIKKIPHIIQHKERIILFKKYVAKEKEMLGLNDSSSLNYTLVTVHRTRILEDSYQQLHKLQPQALKSTIRVKFINEQNLSELGIDQNGIFKEFLEETMRKILDPSLNLFAATTEQRLYPSPTSNLHENHLSLFEFAGKMLGKAVYEGIVIDAPFASFFLNQILPTFHHNSLSQSNNQPSLLYSSIDQLPSLDPELYKSLTYIKHYDGDIDDFNLTFSVDENILGELVTYELIPGGKTISVTKENKISYVHLMAHFRIIYQINQQCTAFVKGFRSIISSEWLAMFSTNELQRLISGDNTPIDLNDLRKNTKYYGGFHNNHRCIKWFWQILNNDFTNEELGLLLKFVTSCSKPPLLGWAQLQPAFSIRCVEVAEELDTGDSVGSVLRGFLTISANGKLGKKDEKEVRLPTSSTCFHLLKLPNYQSKSLLRKKLKYAINSNTGFELS